MYQHCHTTKCYYRKRACKLDCHVVQAIPPLEEKLLLNILLFSVISDLFDIYFFVEASTSHMNIVTF